MAFCYLRVASRSFARVILPKLILDRSEAGDEFREMVESAGTDRRQ